MTFGTAEVNFVNFLMLLAIILGPFALLMIDLLALHFFGKNKVILVLLVIFYVVTSLFVPTYATIVLFNLDTGNVFHVIFAGLFVALFRIFDFYGKKTGKIFMDNWMFTVIPFFCQHCHNCTISNS